MFLDPDAVVLNAGRAADAEQRSEIVGLIDGSVFVVVFTEREGATRVISARRANRKEERAYGDRESKT